MTPDNVQQAKAAIVDQLGCVYEVRELFSYIDALEERVKRLEQIHSDLLWQVSPDRMGS